MSGSFRALRVTKGEPPTVEIVRLDEDALMEGDVTVAVRHSTINYKDGLALTGTAPILRRSPMTPGVDFAGTVLASETTEFAPGDLVVLNGWGVGETHDGGLAERARVKSAWLIKLPIGLDAAEAMAIGTAGYTAALCVLALERHGIGPGSGEILVTGAAGGVGSVAVALLAAGGYRVVASSRRAAEEGDYLEALGAATVIDAAELSAPGRPLGEGALGCGDRQRGEPYARQRSGRDPARWRGRRMRSGAGKRSPGHGDAVHPARGDAGRDQLGDGTEAASDRRLGTAGARSRSECPGTDDPACSARGGSRDRCGDRGRNGAGPRDR